jgi:threonine/homoserine/homoserine lactone efflux protein
MRNFRFDWRWIGLLLIVALIANSQVIPWQALALLLIGAGGYMLWVGWRVWTTGTATPGLPAMRQKRVKYWRGQRIELDEPAPVWKKRMPSLRAITPALVYLLIGFALVLGGLGIVWQRV